MNKLRAILYGTYIILILILLMMNMRLCCPQTEPEIPEATQPETPQAPTSPQDEEDYRRAQSIGGSGALKITLLWDFYSDIDLHVTQPNGRTIWYNNKHDNATGGFLDVDNRKGGEGSAENIVWSNPPAGSYNVKLHYFGRRSDSSGLCTVVISQEGMETQIVRVNMSQQGEYKNITTLTVYR